MEYDVVCIPVDLSSTLAPRTRVATVYVIVRTFSAISDYGRPLEKR